MKQGKENSKNKVYKNANQKSDSSQAFKKDPSSGQNKMDKQHQSDEKNKKDKSPPAHAS